MNHTRLQPVGKGTRMRTIAKLALLVSLALSVAGSAQAQDIVEPSDNPRHREAREAYEEGSAHFEAERYEEALEAFERSYNAERLPALLFNMGSALDRMGRPEQAIARYEAYLAAVEEDSNAPYVRSRVRLLHAELSENAPDPAPEVDVDPEPEIDVEPPVVEPPVIEPPAPPSRVGPLLLFIAGGAAAISAVGVGVRALALDDQLRSQCTGGSCPAEAEADAQRVTRFARTTDVMVGVAGAAVLGGVLWWVLSSSGADDEVQASAQCDSIGCAATVQGRF